jgi:hypothetical protein
MSIATEILSLRQDRTSSVTALIAALDWLHVAYGDHRILSRRHTVREFADLVLLNVAVHALEAGPTFPKATAQEGWFKSLISSLRKKLGAIKEMQNASSIPAGTLAFRRGN